MTDENFKDLRLLKSLEALAIEGYIPLTDKFLFYASQLKLKVLMITGVRGQFTDLGVCYLLGLGSSFVRSREVLGASSSFNGLKSSSLEVISLSCESDSSISNAGLRLFFEYCPKLEILQLAGAKNTYNYLGLSRIIWNF
jgi:hypothetical protein